MALSNTTQDHDKIRKWAEARGAQPAEVRGTHKGNQTGILRFCFPNARNRNDENLQEISWDEFFEKFDDNGLELIYQEKTAGGARSNFNKLIYPEEEHASSHGKRSSSRTSATSSRSAGSGSASHSSKTRSISSGRRNSASSGRGSTHGKATATGRGSSRSSNSPNRGHSSSTRKRAA